MIANRGRPEFNTSRSDASSPLGKVDRMSFLVILNTKR